MTITANPQDLLALIQIQTQLIALIQTHRSLLAKIGYHGNQGTGQPSFGTSSGIVSPGNWVSPNPVTLHKCGLVQPLASFTSPPGFGLFVQQHHQFIRDNNCTVEFAAFGFSVEDFMTRRVLLRCDSTGDLYPVTKPSTIPHEFLTSPYTWHKRLEHPGSEVL
ncbi:hypothetical protein Tco_0766005 [Tanacetum coccineum]